MQTAKTKTKTKPAVPPGPEGRGFNPNILMNGNAIPGSWVDPSAGAEPLAVLSGGEDLGFLFDAELVSRFPRVGDVASGRRMLKEYAVAGPGRMFPVLADLSEENHECLLLQEDTGAVYVAEWLELGGGCAFAEGRRLVLAGHVAAAGTVFLEAAEEGYVDPDPEPLPGTGINVYVGEREMSSPGVSMDPLLMLDMPYYCLGAALHGHMDLDASRIRSMGAEAVSSGRVVVVDVEEQSVVEVLWSPSMSQLEKVEHPCLLSHFPWWPRGHFIQSFLPGYCAVFVRPGRVLLRDVGTQSVYLAGPDREGVMSLHRVPLDGRLLEAGSCLRAEELLLPEGHSSLGAGPGCVPVGEWFVVPERAVASGVPEMSFPEGGLVLPGRPRSSCFFVVEPGDVPEGASPTFRLGPDGSVHVSCGVARAAGDGPWEPVELPRREGSVWKIVRNGALESFFECD